VKRHFIRRSGQWVQVDAAGFAAHRAAHPPHPPAPAVIINEPPADPTPAELATNFAAAMHRWASSGFSTVSSELYAGRAAVCAGCDQWDASARFGLGKCNAPGCGCTRFKQWLATERCPLGKWPA